MEEIQIMKILINISIAFLLIVFLVKSENVFVATNEWQEIKEGQSVPAGLHYRMNLETGKKEAKIIDPEETDSQETTSPILSDANPKEGRELLMFLKKKLLKSIFYILTINRYSLLFMVPNLCTFFWNNLVNPRFSLAHNTSLPFMVPLSCSAITKFRLFL